MNITHMTRYNSITQALGPSVYKTALMQMQDSDFATDGMITDETKWFLETHPLISAFREGQFEIESKLIGQNLIQSSTKLKILFAEISKYIGKKEDMFKKFGDFYSSFIMAIDNGTISSQFKIDSQRKQYLFETLPQTLLEMKKGTDNKFLKKLSITKRTDNKEWYDITINKKVVDIEEMKAGWIELYMQNPEIAMDLVDYSFMYGGLGFSANSLSSIIPNMIKSNMKQYIENLKSFDYNIYPYYKRMLYQFMLLNKISMSSYDVDFGKMGI